MRDATADNAGCMRIEDAIGKRIAAARSALGLTQEQLGKLLARYMGKPWPRQAVSSAEKGARAFAAADLVALSLALGRTVEDLIEPPPDVAHVLIGEGPPVDSRHFRAAVATFRAEAAVDEDLWQLTVAMTELRASFPTLAAEVERGGELIERMYRDLRTATRGRRGIDGAQERHHLPRVTEEPT